jgi:hypothetical protein
MDGTTINETDLAQAVREAAVLATVKVSVWSGVKTDAALVEELKKVHQARGNVGKLLKNVMAGADAHLKKVNSAYHAVRQQHYDTSLAWVGNSSDDRKKGPRLVPHTLFDTYIHTIGKKKREAEDILEDYLPKHLGYAREAQRNLSTMADQFYPSEDEVRAKFKITVDFEPIPNSVGFTGLPPGAYERLSKNLNKRLRLQIDGAQKEMFEKAYERIEHLVGLLADEDKKFKEASIRHVRELITLLPGWNVAGNPHVTGICNDIENLLAGVDPEDLRKDKTLRASTVVEAQAIADKLKQLGGV